MKIENCKLKIPLLVGLLALALSCSKEPKEAINAKTDPFWPIFRGDTHLSGVANDALPDRLSLLWSFQTGYEIKSSPVVGSGRVYVGSTDGNVYALNISDGSELWRFDTGDDVEAPPMLLDSLVYVGSLNGTFFALDAATGKEVWRYQTGDEIYGSANWIDAPDGSGKWVLVGSYDFFVYCFDARTGERKWAVETENYINGAPATDGRITVFGGCDEQLHIVSVAEGREIGKVDGGSYIAGSAALFDEMAYLGHYGEKVIAIDIAAKKIVWEYDNNGKAGAFFSSPAVNEEMVVIGSRDKNVHCINRKTGEKIWSFETRDDVDSSPVIAGDKVVAASMDGRLYLLDLKTGRQIWSYEIGADITSCPAVTGGYVFVGAEDGRLYAFGDRK